MSTPGLVSSSPPFNACGGPDSHRQDQGCTQHISQCSAPHTRDSTSVTHECEQPRDATSVTHMREQSQNTSVAGTRTSKNSCAVSLSRNPTTIFRLGLKKPSARQACKVISSRHRLGHQRTTNLSSTATTQSMVANRTATTHDTAASERGDAPQHAGHATHRRNPDWTRRRQSGLASLRCVPPEMRWKRARTSRPREPRCAMQPPTPPLPCCAPGFHVTILVRHGNRVARCNETNGEQEGQPQPPSGRGW